MSYATVRKALFKSHFSILNICASLKHMNLVPLKSTLLKYPNKLQYLILRGVWRRESFYSMLGFVFHFAEKQTETW